MNKIRGKAVGTIDVKRFYIPGITLETACDGCKRPLEIDFSVDYLSYPKVNEKILRYVWCEDCNAEKNIPVVLKLSIELAE